MYITLDADRMLFICKHPDFEVVCNLAYIYCYNNAYHIFDIESHIPYQEFTRTELELIYRQLAIDEIMPSSGVDIKNAIMGITQGFPVTDCNAWEVQSQANYVEKNEGPNYTYVKGATTPAILSDLYAPKRLSRSVVKRIAVQVPKQQIPVAPPVTKVARKSPVKQRIWEVANELWNKEGCPMDKAVILQLRKRIMDVLEDYNIKRNTASSELGNWQKSLSEK